MPLDPSVLANGLENMTPADSEPPAIAAFVDAWDHYFAGSTVSGAPAVAGSYVTGLSAMRGAMVGMSAPNAAALAIQNGIIAFWTAILPVPASIWVPPGLVFVPPVLPPLTLGTIAAALTSVFAANVAASLSLHDACTAIAAVLHTAGGIGGFVPASPPPVPAPLPIV